MLQGEIVCNPIWGHKNVLCKKSWFLSKKSGVVKIMRSRRSVVHSWWSAGHTCKKKNGEWSSPKLTNSFGFLPAWQDSFTQHLLYLGVSTLSGGHAEFWLFVEDPKGRLQRLSKTITTLKSAEKIGYEENRFCRIKSIATLEAKYCNGVPNGQ